MTPSVILINGPKQSGKDTLLGLLLAAGIVDAEVRFSEPVKDIHSILFEGSDFSVDVATQDYKSKANRFDPLQTNRQMMIRIGEWLNKEFGEQLLGTIAADMTTKMLDEGFECVAIPDARLLGQSKTLIREVGCRLEDILYIRLHREGYTYASDMGTYYDLPLPVRTLDVYNFEGNPDAMLEQIMDTVIDPK